MRQAWLIARGAAAVVIGALALAGSARAAHASMLSGETAEGVAVKLTVADSGNATKFKLGKSKVDCDKGGTLTNRAGSYSDFDTSDPGSFSDKSSRSSNAGGYHFKTRATLDGTADGSTWSGTLKLRTKVSHDGRPVDTCMLKTTWDAS